MKQEPRERYTREDQDKTLTSPKPISKEGNDVGYNTMYGEYGSDERGWVDRPEEFQAEALDGHTYIGIGPKNYRRSDANIREEVCEALTWDAHVDASDVEVEVSGGEVTLSGSVPEPGMKSEAGVLAEGIRGVTLVRNHLRLKHKGPAPFTN